MPTKAIPIEVTQRRSVTFDLGIPYWDQLVQVATEILKRKNDGIPDNADVTLGRNGGGGQIVVEWDDVS